MDIRRLLRHFPFLREVYEFGGLAGWVITTIFGTSVLMVMWSSFFESPAIVLAAAAFFAYYALRAAEFAINWWNKTDLRSALIFDAGVPHITTNADGTFNASVEYHVINNSDHEIAIIFDEEIAFVGSTHVISRGSTAPMILPPKGRQHMRTDPVRAVANGCTENLSYKGSARFGQAKQHMNVRWWVSVEIDLTDPHGVQPNPGWRMLKNDFERVY